MLGIECGFAESKASAFFAVLVSGQLLFLNMASSQKFLSLKK